MVVRFKVLAGLVAVGATVGCASLRVGSDYDRDVSFAARETYDWVDSPEEDAQDVARVNPFIERRLRRAVDDELEFRGYRRVEDGPVDVLVSVSVLDAAEAGRAGVRLGFPLMVGFSFGFAPAFYYPGYGYGYRGYLGSSRYGRYGFGRRVAFGSYRPYFGYPYGYGSFGPYGYYGGGRTGSLESLAPGTFIIDIIDGDSGELIWRGWANGALSFAPDVDELPDFIGSVVHDIMEEFPPDDG